MIERVRSYMEQHHMVEKGDHICIGVSGGADSVCLFRILEALRRPMGFTVSAVHIEHGIRGRESVLDQEFVRRLSEAYDVPFSAYAYPVEELSKAEGISVEEAGRNVRRKAYAREMECFGGRAKTALAHHADDNAETLLFHLCRGSGIEGLAGIYPARGNLIRPLLCVGRRDVEAYLKEIGQAYRTDATNADTAYSRNRIRNCIMPQLAKVNKKAAAHINHLAEDALELSAYLQNESQKLLEKYREKTKEGETSLTLAGFDAYPSVLKKQVFLELLAELSGSRKDLAREHANAILDLSVGRTGRQISLPYGIVAKKAYGTLLFYQRAKKPEAEEKFEAVSLTEFPLERTVSGGKICCRLMEKNKKDVKFPKNLYTKWFDYDKIKIGLCIRTREAGDYFTIDAKGHRQKLGDYLVNEKMPREARAKLLLLADGSHILWAIGGRMSEHYKITEHTKRILEVQYLEEWT